MPLGTLAGNPTCSGIRDPASFWIMRSWQGNIPSPSRNHSGSKHPEVTLCYDGRRTLEDPDSRWLEFTGKSAGQVKCDSAHAERKCREHAERYAEMKRKARTILDGRGSLT